MRAFKTGGISVCFHCQAQLVRIKGGFIFAEVIDPDGHRLRVHKDCQEAALGHGYTLPPEDVTAARRLAERARCVPVDIGNL